MPNLIIGAGGFLGSALKVYASEELSVETIGITRENYQRWASPKVRWGIVVWAAGMSSKRDCRPESIDDKCYQDNVIAVKKAVRDFPCDKFVYISSYDVYDPPYLGTPPDEAGQLMSDREFEIEPYGLYKWMGEEEAKKANSFLQLRCNGFSGVGLKKNVIFDLTQSEPKLYVSWDSKFQYMHAYSFSHILFKLAGSYSDEVFNVTSPEPATPVDVANLLDINLKAVRMPRDRIVPKVQSLLDVTKMVGALNKMGIPIPSSKEAILNWNKPIPVPHPKSGIVV